MYILRRDFLKYCAGSAAALGLELSPFGTLEKALAAGDGSAIIVPSYPIATPVITTLDRTVQPVTPPPLPEGYTLYPSDIQDYATYQYGEWTQDADTGFTYLCPDMQQNPVANVPASSTPNGPDPSSTAQLLSFFTMSDIHICDKESPARAMYYAYQYPIPEVENPLSTVQQPSGNSSAYSAITLYTTQVLDAAVQTINYLHQNVAPFDFGIGLGDACDNTQYNELRWYIDVIDGKLITPSSGAHHGALATQWNYQWQYQAAGLDKSIKWYQAIGNHDQFWMGSAPVTNHIRNTLVGPNVLRMGAMALQPPYYIEPDWTQIMSGDEYAMGVVDGTTQFGKVINVGDGISDGPINTIVPDPNRRSLSINQWMNEFFNTTSQPVGHGFTRQMVQAGFACYSFYPKANVPIKIIVLDDTDKSGTAQGALDNKRYNWLINQLEAGQAADQLMIVCAHIPVHPYGQKPPSAANATPPNTCSMLPIWNQNPSFNENVSEEDLLTTLHSYPNFIAWIAGHVHRNTITPQPDPLIPGNGFWEIETPSLRDFPRGFRCFQIVRNPADPDTGDWTISIFVQSVDPSANPDPVNLINDDTPTLNSPAYTSRSYSVASQQIFGNPTQQGPGMDPSSCIYNAELVIPSGQLSQNLRNNLPLLTPVVSSLKINGGAVSTTSTTVTLNNTVTGTTPYQYMASELPSFEGAAWQAYSNAPSYTFQNTTPGTKTVYFQVVDGLGNTSTAVHASIRLRK